MAAEKIRVLTLVHAPANLAVPRRIALSDTALVLGREPGPDGFVLEDDRASRRHARIKRRADGNGYLVEDLKSRNGTTIDGKKIAREALRDGAVLRVGSSLFVYYEDADRSDRKLALLALFRPLTTSAAEALLIHDPPDAEALAERAKKAAAGGRIERAHLELHEAPPAAGEPADKEALLKLLEAHGGNIAEVARATGKHRPQVYRWMRRFGIDPSQFRGT